MTRSDAPAPAPSSPGRSSLRRGVLWAVLVLALAAVAAITVWTRLPEREPLPILTRVPSFELVSQTGATVERSDLAGTVWVADFVFTRCVTACPVMTGRLAELGRDLPEGAFRRVSISVDPEHDTPEVLRRYQETRDLEESWLFLTGERDAIYTLMRDGFLLAVDPDTGDPENPIAHSTRFSLVDSSGRVRGYYDALLAEEMARLEDDLAWLLDSEARGLEPDTAPAAGLEMGRREMDRLEMGPLEAGRGPTGRRGETSP